MLPFLVQFLVGCCCCCPTSAGVGVPTPVPPSHADLVGTWVCNDGQAWTFRPDGTYAYRERYFDHYSDGVIESYGDKTIDTRSAHWYDFPAHLGPVDLELRPNGLCMQTGGTLCAKADPTGAPEALRGSWKSGATYLNVRDDGFATSNQGTGLLRVDGSGLYLDVCAVPVPLPLIFDADGLVQESTRLRLERSRTHFDEVRSGGGGGGGGSSHDFDAPSFDFDFD